MIGAVGAENPRRVPFAFADRSRMIQQRAQRPHRNRKIGTENRFTEKVEKGAAGRRTQKTGTAGMPRRMPRIFVHFGKIGQRTEHRRQNKPAVSIRRRQNTAADKIRRIFQNPDKIVDIFQNLGRNFRSVGPSRQQKHRQLAVMLTQNFQHFDRIAIILVVAAAQP